MPHIPFISDEKLSKESKAAIDGFEQVYQRPPHPFRVMAHNENFVKTAWYAWKTIVVDPSNLERWVKEAIVVITAFRQQAEYCWQGHSNALCRLGVTEEQAHAIRTKDLSMFSEPERSIFEFAHKAASAPKTLTGEDYDHLRQLGLSEEVILEILSIVWVNTAMNNIVNAVDLKRTPGQMKELSLL